MSVTPLVEKIRKESRLLSCDFFVTFQILISLITSVSSPVEKIRKEDLEPLLQYAREYWKVRTSTFRFQDSNNSTEKGY